MPPTKIDFFSSFDEPRGRRTDIDVLFRSLAASDNGC